MVLLANQLPFYIINDNTYLLFRNLLLQRLETNESGDETWAIAQFIPHHRVTISIREENLRTMRIVLN